MPIIQTAQSWTSIVEPITPFLNQVTERLLDQVSVFDSDIQDAIEYALSKQGKHIRPALVAISAESCGGIREEHVQFALIVEMVHLATLVHDDIMDGALLRRGRPTMAAAWGNSLSVLVGDCLFAHALKLASEFPTTEICRVVSTAANHVCSGEIIQTRNKNRFDISVDECLRVLDMKTATLFSLSCQYGAVLSQATPHVIHGMKEFGSALGMAYQIYDDCVDLFSTERQAGKSLGTDVESGKITLPVLLAYKKLNSKEKLVFETAFHNEDGPEFETIREHLLRCNALDETKSTISEYLNKARESVWGVSLNGDNAYLLQITDFLTQQTEQLSVS